MDICTSMIGLIWRGELAINIGFYCIVIEWHNLTIKQSCTISGHYVNTYVQNVQCLNKNMSTVKLVQLSRTTLSPKPVYGVVVIFELYSTFCVY